MKVKDIVMKEAVLKAIEPGKRATIDDPEHGKTIELDLTKPENAASLRPNDQGELEYDPTPDMTTPGAQGQGGPTVGSEVSIKTDEDTHNSAEQILRKIAQEEDFDLLYKVHSHIGSKDPAVRQAANIIDDLYQSVASDLGAHADDDFEKIYDRVLDHVINDYGSEETSEEVGGDPTDDFINDVEDHGYGVHEAMEQVRMLRLAGLHESADKVAAEKLSELTTRLEKLQGR